MNFTRTGAVVVLIVAAAGASCAGDEKRPEPAALEQGGSGGDDPQLGGSKGTPEAGGAGDLPSGAGGDAFPTDQGGSSGSTGGAAEGVGDSGGVSMGGAAGTAGEDGATGEGGHGASGAPVRSGGVTILNGAEFMRAMDAYQLELPSASAANPGSGPLPLGVLLFASDSKTDAIQACGEERQRSGAALMKVFVAADGQLEPGTYPHQRWTEELKGDLGAAAAVPGTFFAVATSSLAGCTGGNAEPVCECDLVTGATSFVGGELTLSEVDGAFVGQITLDAGSQTWSGSFSLPSCSKTVDQHLAIANGTLNCIP
jgi:hypothetical protein